MDNSYRLALAELGAVMDGIDDGAVDRACRAIAGAKRIMLYGCGREGLQMRGLAMRLHHLGLDVCFQGDMAASPLGRGDLFVASAGPGELATVSALAGVAAKAGADMLFLTAQPASALAASAKHLLVIPAQTMADDHATRSILPMGSLYEGAMFVLFETMILRLRTMLAITPEAMRANHTNME